MMRKLWERKVFLIYFSCGGEDQNSCNNEQSHCQQKMAQSSPLHTRLSHRRITTPPQYEISKWLSMLKKEARSVGRWYGTVSCRHFWLKLYLSLSAKSTIDYIEIIWSSTVPARAKLSTLFPRLDQKSTPPDLATYGESYLLFEYQLTKSRLHFTRTSLDLSYERLFLDLEWIQTKVKAQWSTFVTTGAAIRNVVKWLGTQEIKREEKGARSSKSLKV